MSVSNCESTPQTPGPQLPQNNNPGPPAGGPRPRGHRAPPPTPPLSEFVEKFQETLRNIFQNTHESLKNAFPFFSESPAAASKPSDEIRQKLEELSDSPDLNLGLSLLCWSVGADVDKCPAFLEESLKSYLQKSRPKL